MTPKRSDFPADFLWGTATAAYQIEGAVDADGRGTSIWDTFSHTQGTIKNGDNGDQACDHYKRWQDDVTLMAELGLNAYRFSVAWARVMPEGRGLVNNRGLDFYDRLVDRLLALHLEPWVTLYHWDLPQALQDRGGWCARDTAEAFVEYANVVAARLGDRVSGWMTHNEPWCAGFLGHLFGIHAPGQHDLGAALQATHHLLLSHGLATQALRARLPKARVGIVLNLAPAHAASTQPADAAAARRQDGFSNRWFLDPVHGRGYPADMLTLFERQAPGFAATIKPGDFETIAAPIDFVGINYYNRHVVADAPGSGLLELSHQRPPGEYTYFDWEVYPAGLSEILLYVHKNYGPQALYVTENGATFRDDADSHDYVNDEARRRYLEKHIAACRDARQQGAPLRGYFVWSLLDNFEWAEGYDKRFGLVRVNFETQARVVKASGRWLSRLLHEGPTMGDAR